MNKKGAVFHWILFGVIASIGLYFLLVVNLDLGTETKGVWQLSFVRATLDAEKDLLFIDQNARSAVGLAVQGLSKEELANDFGCGIYKKNYPFWNKENGFCELQADESIKNKINDYVISETGITYDQVFFSEGYLIGKSSKKKVITSSWDAIPLELKNTGLFSSYESYVLKPFYLNYFYNPNFKVKVGSFFGQGYIKVRNQAEVLVNTCMNSKDLKSCLDKNKMGSWGYEFCGADNYEEQDRKVPFCVQVNENNKFQLALDFSPALPFSPEDLIVTFDSVTNVTAIEFIPVSGIESYNFYYTDWLAVKSSNSFPNTASEVFTAKPNFNYQKIFSFKTNGNCPEVKELNKAYLCFDKVVYQFKDEEISETVFTVTSVQDGKESLVEGFVGLS